MPSPEQLEQQRRSVAMLPPRAMCNVVLHLEREEALDVLAYARDVSGLRSRWVRARDVDDDEDQAVA